MSELFQGHTKVKVSQCRITSLTSKRTAEVSRMVNSIDVYMSILHPTTTAVLNISDTSGTLYALPLVGEEIVQLELESPGMPAVNKTFFVYKINDLSQDSNNTKTNIELHLVSLDHIRGSSQTVDHGTNCTLSESVQNILKDTIRTSASVEVEPTNGVERITFTGWTAWESIELLRKRAVSVKYQSPYYFFEDNNGYHFVSAEYLIEQRKASKEPIKITAVPFNPGAGDGPSKSTINETQYRNVDNFTVLKKSNVADSIRKGGLSNRTYVFDILEKTASVVDRDVKTFAQDVKQPLDDKFHKQHSDLWTDIIDKPLTKFMVPIDSTNPTAHAHNYGHRTMFNKHFGSIQVGFTMFGDTSLNPGDILYIQVPGTINDTSDDPQLTGNYVTVNIRHNISNDEMFTLVEAYRFGLAGDVL